MAKNVNVWKRGSQSDFKQQSRAKMKRNMFGMRQQHRTTFELGRLVPFFWQPTMPGDLWYLQHELMLRFLPLYFPIMHKIDVSIHYFYEPIRVLWRDDKQAAPAENRGWGDFITEKHDVEWPHCNLRLGNGSNNGSIAEDSIAAYMGIPTTGGAVIQEDTDVWAAPAAMYAHVYDDYYRSDHLQTERFLGMTEGENDVYRQIYYEKPFQRGWEHDYFTSALPSAQAGADVLVPLFDEDDPPNASFLNAFGSGPATGDAQFVSSNTNLHDSAGLALRHDAEELNEHAAHMREFRLAAQLLEYYERSERLGTRYRDVMAGRFGFDPMPGVIDEPVYIGGSKGEVVIQDVMSTAQTVDSADNIVNPVGEYTGQAMALEGSKGYKFFAPEHGIIMGFISLRPRTAYYQGIPRHFQHETAKDFPWLEFAHIGDQAIKKKELYWDHQATAGTNEETFGYVPRYQEWRSATDTMSGYMRTSLDNYHLGRKFTTPPSLNANFIACSPRTVDVFQKQEGEHEVFANILCNNRVARQLPRFGYPRL